MTIDIAKFEATVETFKKYVRSTVTHNADCRCARCTDDYLGLCKKLIADFAKIQGICENSKLPDKVRIQQVADIVSRWNASIKALGGNNGLRLFTES